MDSDRKKKDDELPPPARRDRDELTGEEARAALVGQDELDGELPEEDDDNPYQNSDEALPDDEEEAAIRRNLSREDSGQNEE
jgi:hypothetical protein